MKIKISGIVNDSIVDGPGLRLTVFAQGCAHGCAGCHNPQTHDINGGYYIDTAEIIAAIDKNPLLDGVTISGGEPFLQPEAFAFLAGQVRKKGLNIIVYTGYEWDGLIHDSNRMALVSQADIIVDGKFIKELKTLDIPFVGSSNQRVIDVKKSIGENRVVVFNFGQRDHKA